jgi:zinc protease
MKRIGQVGGISNAFTSFDQTTYHNTVPAQYLDMALWLEADRMSSFKVSEEIYKTERKVVAEEWRMRFNQPYGNLFELFLKNAFMKHSYRWTPIGNMDHLKAARVNELQDFFNTYYLPNNATLVIAGDIDVDAAKQLVRKYYGWIPKGALPARNIPQEPEQTEPRLVEVDEAVPLTAVLIGYHGPTYRSDDHYALSALDAIMGSGDSGRLNRLLVNNDKPMCVATQSMSWQVEDKGIFAIGGTVMAGKDANAVKQILIDAVADVAKNGASADELAKAKTILKVGIIQGRRTAQDLATQLGEEQMFGGQAERVNTALAKIEALTPEMIKMVAAKYLSPENSTTLFMRPSVLAALHARAAATQASAVKDAPVMPATAPVEPRVINFPDEYPKHAPTAEARENPKFAKGMESDINGIKVIVMPDPRLPLVNWSLTMRRGSQADPKGKEGVAWLTSEMVRRGVEGINFEQLTKDLDSRGISITVGDGGDYTRLTGSSTTDQLEHAMKRSRQILRTPTFPADEFAKLKEQSVNSLLSSQESPTTAAGNELTTALWGDTPLGRYATPASVAAITLDDVKRFYEQVYRPSDAIFIISGDVTLERGQALAKELLDAWPAGELPTVDINLPEHSPRRRIILIDRPEAKQASVRIGIPAYTVRSDEKYAGAIANQILTAGIDSRLGRYVRAEKGLAYSVRGLFKPNRQAGAFIAETETALETAPDAVEAIFKVLTDMRTANVTDNELAEAKTRVSGSMVMAVQTIDQQAGYRVDGILNGYPIDYYDRYPQRVGKVTADEVRDVMKKYVKDDEVTIVVVAPAATAKQQLERLGDVQVVPMPSKRAVAATQKKAA